MEKLLSVCMIVKNEEKVLERCLRSIHGIADEIIVVDTGSTDKTKEIALQYTDKVYDFEWANDFAKARNYAASKATGEWILAIDADEYVDRDQFEKFKEQLKTDPPNLEINAVEIISFVGRKAEFTFKNLHARFYKNNSKIKYFRPIHEDLKYIDDREYQLGVVDLQLFHSGYMKGTIQEKEKSKRNLPLLLNLENKKSIDYFYIGNEYRNLGDLDKAILYYQKAYKERESDQAEYILQLLIFLIDALYKKKRYREALEVIQSCEIAYPKLADFKYYKGLIYQAQNKYNKAKSIFEHILSNKDRLSARSEEFKEYAPLVNLANIYEEKGNLHKAVEYYSKALSINPSKDAMWSKLLHILGKHSSLEELTGFINRKVVPSKGMNEQRMINILLNVPLLNVQKLTRSLLDNENLSNIENEALWIKNYLLDLNFKEVHSHIENKTLGELIVLMKTKIFTIEDFFIQIHEYNSKNTMDKLKRLSQLNNFANMFSLLFAEQYKKSALNENEEFLFINIYRQAKVLGVPEIVKKLDSKLFLLNDREQIKKIKNM